MSRECVHYSLYCGDLTIQGGFAHCYELIDTDTGTVYAGKIVPKASLTKPHQRDKVNHSYASQTLSLFPLLFTVELLYMYMYIADP